MYEVSFKAFQKTFLTHFRLSVAVTRMQEQKPPNNTHADTDARTDT